jgi:group II intron reverse transcriptase/maturase
MKIGEMQRKLSLWAEQDKERKFYGLFDLVCDMDWLRLACDHVSQNAGSKTAGCDGINMATFWETREGNLQRIREDLRSGKFEVCPVRRVCIPKANGKMRPLGIPSIRDRIVQEAVRMVLEPIYEADFSQLSFGFRPNRRTLDAIRHLMCSARERAKYFWVIEGDIASYFDTINHRRLVKLLRRRVSDEKLLGLIWKFLRAGVMEQKLFKDTRLGTPQGGIISPLLANVYLHELDKFMDQYTTLTPKQRAVRRQQGLANFAYARYADDFVVLCNGTKEQTLELRERIREFLTTALRLTLSMEKTKVTHLNDGFDFLGFHLQRTLGGQGKMVTKVTISDKAMRHHREIILVATSPATHQESFAAKILALNRIIAGWCRYFQCTSKATSQFSNLTQVTFWRVAHWLGRKHKLNMPEVMRRYRTKGSLGTAERQLLRHDSFKTRYYTASPRKPNPYTTQSDIEREELLDEAPWLGGEKRPGTLDLRPVVFKRDQGKCRVCHQPVTLATSQMDHIIPVRHFKRPVEATRLSNLWTLCLDCHKRKTEMDRQGESRVQ